MVNEIRTIWFFYVVEDLYGVERGDIYAFTDHRDYAKAFRKHRTKSLFYEKECEVTREEYNDLIQYYIKRELIKYRGTTRGEEDGYQVVKEFEVILTKLESIQVQNIASLYSYNELPKLAWYPYESMRLPCIKALHALLYTRMHEYTITGEYPTRKDGSEAFYIDTFMILMAQYGPLFRITQEEEMI